MVLISTSVLAVINTDSVTAVGQEFKTREKIRIMGTAYSNIIGYNPRVSYSLATDEGFYASGKSRSNSITLNREISFNTPGQHYATITFTYRVLVRVFRRWTPVVETAEKTFVFNINNFY